MSHLGDGKSPVSGERWKRTLSKEYKKRKSEVSSETIANMELFGDMLDALNVRIFGNNRIAVEIKGDQAEKADGHNHLTGRKSKTIKRRFIPGENQTFKRDIQKTISEVTERFEKKEDGE